MYREEPAEQEGPVVVDAKGRKRLRLRDVSVRLSTLALLAVLLIFFAFTAERMGSARLPKGSAEKKLEN